MTTVSFSLGYYVLSLFSFKKDVNSDFGKYTLTLGNVLDLQSSE